MAGIWTTLLDRAHEFTVTHTIWNELFGGTGNMSLVRRTYARDISAQEVVNDGSETTVFTETIPGNNVGPDAQICLTLWGDFLNNSGGDSTPTVRVKFGGATLMAYAATLTTNANRRTFKLICNISQYTASSQFAVTEAWFADPAAEGGTAAITSPPATSRISLTINTTTSQTLSVTWDHDGGTSTRSFFMRFARFEIIP